MNRTWKVDEPTTDSGSAVKNPPPVTTPNQPLISTDNRFCGFQIDNGEHKGTVFLLSPDESENGSWSLPVTDESSLKEAWEHRNSVDTHAPLEERIHALSDAKGYSVPDVTHDKKGCGCGCGGSQKDEDSHDFDIDSLLGRNSSDDESEQEESDIEQLDWENTSVRRRKESVNPLEL